MSKPERSRTDLLVDLLAEEVAERLRVKAATPPSPPPLPPRPAPQAPPKPPPEPQPEPEAEVPPPPPGRPHAARLMGRLALTLLVLVVAVNIPFNRYGTTLATAMPDTPSLVIRDGLVVKEEDDPEIYVFQNDQFRWISSLDAFEHYGYTWGDVHTVPDGYLDGFEIGPPIHVLLKCPDSPHIYQLENGVRHWIVDIETFEDEGYVWEDVRMVTCDYLRNIPQGETIPPGHGPAPEP